MVSAFDGLGANGFQQERSYIALQRKQLEIKRPFGEPTSAMAIIVIKGLTSLLGRQMDLPVNNGVVVTDIEEGSLAEASGLQPGDVILELNRQHVATFSALQRFAEPLKPTDLALLLVNRQGNVMYVPIQGE